jgi:hypothetical protein
MDFRQVIMAYINVLSQYSPEENEEEHKKSVGIASNPAETQTGYTSNISLGHYPYTNLLHQKNCTM